MNIGGANTDDDIPITIDGVTYPRASPRTQ